MIQKLASILTWRAAKRLVIAVIGSTVVLLGLVLFILPGPGIPLLLGGLAILATEFVWAATLLKKVKAQAMGAASKFRNGIGWGPEKEAAEADNDPQAQPPAERRNHTVTERN
jgi:hypothetical protein